VYVGIRGQGEIIVDFSAVPIGAGLVTVAARGCVHHYTPRTRRADAWMLMFTPEFLALGEREREPLSLLTVGPKSLRLERRVHREVLTMCEILAKEYARPVDALQRPLLATMARAVFLQAERGARLASPAPSTELARFFATLERDILVTRSVAHYARASGLSRRRLGELLVEHTGRAIKPTIDERATLEIKRLLAHTDLSVKELAERTGFSEPTNFVKFFRAHAQQTPLEFRASVGKP
jgi:AraC-like DNA-binding protein